VGKPRRRKTGNPAPSTAPTASPATAEPLREAGALWDFAFPGFWLTPLVAFLALLVLHVATLAPSVMGGDGGELVSAALTGGVPHPPGYPLLALLARAFAALPLGPSPAWRVNLLSAVSTAAAAGLLCALLQA